MVPACVYACQTMGRHAPNETADGVLLLQLGSTERTDAYCPKGFIIDVRQASMGASHWYQFLHPPQTACILHQNATVQGWTMDPTISPEYPMAVMVLLPSLQRSAHPSTEMTP